MDKPPTYWEGDTLYHHWYGSSQPDELAYWQPAKRGEDRGRLLYDSIDDTVVFRFYEKPTPEEALSKILEYQRG